MTYLHFKFNSMSLYKKGGAYIFKHHWYLQLFSLHINHKQKGINDMKAEVQNYFEHILNNKFSLTLYPII